MGGLYININYFDSKSDPVKFTLPKIQMFKKQRTPHLNPRRGEEVINSKKFPLPVRERDSAFVATTAK